MSETPTPIKGQIKRRGLALPPRGQALARLQDLEKDAEADVSATAQPVSEQPPNEDSNAVNTASSNAVTHEGSTSLLTDNHSNQGIAHPTQAVVSDFTPNISAQNPEAISLLSAASGTGHYPQVRAAREPTTRITVDMPDSLHRKISLLSVETRRSIKDLVIEALATTYFRTDDHSA